MHSKSTEPADLIGAVQRMRLWKHPAEDVDPGEDAGGWWHHMFSPHH